MEDDWQKLIHGQGELATLGAPASTRPSLPFSFSFWLFQRLWRQIVVFVVGIPACILGLAAIVAYFAPWVGVALIPYTPVFLLIAIMALLVSVSLPR